MVKQKTKLKCKDLEEVQEIEPEVYWSKKIVENKFLVRYNGNIKYFIGEEILMALVKCPECGRENVSDSAEMCPDCGYGIRAHFEKITLAEMEKKKRIQQEEIDKREMEKIPLPSKPSKPLFFANSDPKYINALQMYELAQRDPDAYRRRILEAKRIVANAEAQKWLNRPKCPQCGSDKIVKISTTNRAVSIAVTGLASGKIGKQYQCKNCKHMW